VCTFCSKVVTDIEGCGSHVDMKIGLGITSHLGCVGFDDHV